MGALGRDALAQRGDVVAAELRAHAQGSHHDAPQRDHARDLALRGTFAYLNRHGPASASGKGGARFPAVQRNRKNIPKIEYMLYNAEQLHAELR